MSQIIQVRDVPDDVHQLLVRKAEQEGLSLNRYLLGEFERIARRNKNAEIFAEAARSMKGKKRPTTEEVVAAIRRHRDA